MAGFLDLPLEMLIDILCYLDVIDTYTCRRTCRMVYNIISDSMKLQYFTKVKIAGMQDNPYCKLSIADRLSALENRESCWKFANWRFFTGIDVPSSWSGLYYLTPSIYLLGKSDSDLECATTGVQTIKLPYQDHNHASLVEWTEFNFGMDIIDFGTAIEEHDLLACVSSVHDETNCDLQHVVVAFFRYSTQKMHDRCTIPVIRICCARRSEGIPRVSIEIVGENLAVIVMFNRDVTMRHDFLHIFNWKSGKIKSAPLPVNNTGLAFLREDLLLNPNIVRKSLDVYHIPPSSAPPTTTSASVRLIHSFLLPAVTHGCRITNVSCRSDPNPTANASFPKYTRSNRPFSNDPACAIIIFALEIQLAGVEVRDFVMITHRKALLDALPWAFHQPVTLPGTLKGHSTSTTSSEQRPLPCPMTPWKSWGPPNTRWFNADHLTTAFITTTAGQRCVQYVASIKSVSARDNRIPDTIVILDFNSWHVKLADYEKIRGLNAVLIGGESSRGCTRKDTAYEQEENICLAHGAFEEDLLGRLPFVAYKLPERWDYDAVLLDEERILGIRADDEASLDVMYIG